MLAFDFLTLKLAIYFILPAAVIYVLASLCAPALTLAAQTVVERDVSQDTAAGLMAYSVVASVGLAALVYWLTLAPWASLTSGVAAFFVVGAFVFSSIKDFSRNGRKSVAPIGLRKGFLLSAIVTFGLLILTLSVFLVCRLAT